MHTLKIIRGGLHEDDRGIVSFVNDFDLTPIKRFYQIHHLSTDIIRAWQGHKKESKWFHCTQGEFILNCVRPQKWENPLGTEEVQYFELKSQSPCVLYVPCGYVTGFKALMSHSTLMVYSDFTLSESQTDDFRFDINTWLFKNKA